MSQSDSVDRAFDDLRRAHEAGRLAHAYLLVGHPKGDAARVAERLLQLLFCTHAQPPCGECVACVHIAKRQHQDVVWIEPTSRGRIIKIEEIRRLNQRMSRTSFAGAWKAGVLLYADRMGDEAANAFLKTLEEPPARSLLLMVTSSPEHLPTTIVSRCQRILVSGGQSVDAAEWLEPLLDIMRDDAPGNVLGSYGKAARIDTLLRQIKDSIATAVAEEEGSDDVDDKIIDARIQSRLKEARADLLRTISGWHRDVVMHTHGVEHELLQFPDDAEATRRQSDRLDPRGALDQLRVVEDVVRRLDRNLPDRTVFEAAMIEQAKALARAKRDPTSNIERRTSK